jgi:Concanavalin A-like lectin/glucanases superfamily/HYR domain
VILAQYGEAFTPTESFAVAFHPGETQGIIFQYTVSIVDITFSQSVAGGVLLVRHPISGHIYAQISAIPAGNRVELVVPSGVPIEIIMAVETGTGGETGSTRRVVRKLTEWTGVNMPTDVILPRTVNVTESAILGTYSGTFDVVGETELPSSTMPFYTGFSKVTATYYSTAFPNYGGWDRRTVIPGDPSSGAFELFNLTSSASIAANDPGAGSGYGVQAETFISHKLPSANYAAQYLRTRVIGSAELPAVPANGGVSLGNRLVMNPGYLRGKIIINGPNTIGGVTPLLSMVKTAADDDVDGDGIPNLPVPASPMDWLFKSGIGSYTKINSQSGYGGMAWMVMERTFSATDVDCEYELAVATPNSETVEWTHPSVSLKMNNTDNSEAQYFDTSYYLTHNGAAPISMAPGSTITRNDTVEMGEVILTLRPAAGSGVLIWQPQLQWGNNGLTGFPENTWTVNSIGAYGWPTTAAQAGNRATLRTVLPAGTYTVRPSVRTVAGGNQGSTSMAGFQITVPARGRVVVDNGVMIMPFPPLCITAAGGGLNGIVDSDGSSVTSITWQLDNGPATAAVFIPGVNASYGFSLPAGLAGTHTLTVTAITADGRTASYTQQARVDNVPPEITCPANLDIYSAINAPQPVNYYAPLVTDDCNSVGITCVPPSGSVFPMGTTVVTCTAVDRAGNTSNCSFTITLHPPCAPPIRSHQFDAAAGTCFRYTNVPGWHNNVAMTIEAWVKRADANACETIVAQNYTSSFWFGFCSGKLRFYRSGGAYADADENVPADQWTYVAVTYDGTVASFYINGTNVGRNLLANSGTGNSDPINIGGDYTGGNLAYGFTGMIDELRIYNRQLGAGEISGGIGQQIRSGSGLAATFGSGGAREDLFKFLPFFTTPTAPTPQIEGILPKWLNIPQVTGVAGVDGSVNTATEYANAEKMVIRYDDGINGVQDAIAHLNYHDQPGDRALYIGIKGIRNVIAPSLLGQEASPGWL